MKHLYHLLLFFTCLTVCIESANAQNFLKQGKVWNTIADGFFNPVYSVRYILNGFDTLDNNVYMKLHRTLEEDSTGWHQQGLLREDSLGKVFYRAIGDTSEQLLYNFSVKTGDTILFKNSSFIDTCFLKVTSVDSILLKNGEYRKRINYYALNLGQNVGLSWIEGIGALVNPFYSNEFYCALVDAGEQILCYYENGVLLFNTELYSDCFINATYESNPFYLKLYPNPVINEIHISSPTFETLNFQMFNSVGQFLASGQINNGDNIIPTSGLSNGSYTLLISSKLGLQSVHRFSKL